MKVYQISAIILKVKDMEKSCYLYSKILGFRLAYGGKPPDRFTTFEIGKENKATTYLNLELIEEDHEDDCSSCSADFNNKPNLRGKTKGSQNFGRVIFHTDSVDKLYSYMQYDQYVSKSIIFENKPTNATLGRKVLSYSRTKWLSIIICTAIVVNGSNNFLVIVVFYFLGDRLA